MGNVVALSSRWTSATPAMLTKGVRSFLALCGPRKWLLETCHPALKVEHAAYRDAVAAFASAFHQLYPNYDDARLSSASGPTDRSGAAHVTELLRAVYTAREAFDAKRLTVTATERWLARSAARQRRHVRV